MEHQDKPTMTLLQQIQSGAVDPRDIDKDIRQQMVEVMWNEGTSVPQIATVFKVSDKTIRRDVSDIKARIKLSPDFEWAKAFIGNLVSRAEVHCSHLMRLARNQGVSVNERALSEYYAWKVIKELTEKLQTLGYLPLVPHKVSADIYHHDDEDVKTLGELKEELFAIEGIAEKDGILDEQIKEKIRFLQLKIEKAEISQDIASLNKNQEEGQNE
jgi:hypothetical protein